MLKSVRVDDHAVTSVCDCGREHRFEVSTLEKRTSGWSLGRLVTCECGAKHVAIEHIERSPEELRRMELNRQVENILVISVPCPSDAIVTRYFDVIAAEVVIGTGFLSELVGSFADFWGTSATTFEDKLMTAKKAAITKLKIQAQRLGANAILGADIDYAIFAANMIMVVANGTPVIIDNLNELQGADLTAKR